MVLKILSIALGMATLAILPSARADPPLPIALRVLEPGQWALRSPDSSAPPRTLCISDPRVLLQLRHGGGSCSKYLITNDAAQVVVHYACAGQGNGRTTVRVETPRVVQIESQGIEGKQPFDLAYEGRRVGECAMTGSTAQR